MTRSIQTAFNKIAQENKSLQNVSALNTLVLFIALSVGCWTGIREFLVAVPVWGVLTTFNFKTSKKRQKKNVEEYLEATAEYLNSQQLAAADTAENLH